MPVVNGLFSAIDLRASPAVSVEVRTQAFRTSARPRQHSRGSSPRSAAFLALTSSRSIAARDRSRPCASRSGASAGPSRRRRGLRPAPLGGRRACLLRRRLGLSERSLFASGSFSIYYIGFGVDLPNDYWLEWLQHLPAQATTALVLLRIPALVCLCATWVIFRWIAAAATEPRPARIVLLAGRSQWPSWSVRRRGG